MTTEALGKIYAGLDLHSNNVMCSLRNERGEVVLKRKVETRLEAVIQVLAPYRGQLQAVAVESTFNWYWLVDGLRDAEYPAVLANPAKMEQYSGLKVTNDETDAGWIAEMLRLGILPEAYIYPRETRPLRDLLRRRQLINRQSTQTVLSLKSMIIRHTSRSVTTTRLRRWTREDVDATFSDPMSRTAATMLMELQQYQQRQIRHVEAMARQALQADAVLTRLMTIPGIGDVLGLTIHLETGPLDRFRDAGHYASYCRSVPSRRLSNDSKKGENNRKNGNRYLGWAFIEAANFAIRYCPEIKAWYQRKTRRSLPVVARRALAGKLAKAAYYVMRDEVLFDVKKLLGC